MKRINQFLIVIFIFSGAMQIKAQDEAVKVYSDQFAETYGVLAQGKEMSKEDEQKILKRLSTEMKSKLDEIKKLNKEKYFQLLRQNSFPGVWSLSEDAPIAIAGSLIGSTERSEQYKKQKELEVGIELLALKFKNANSSEQSKLKSDLAASLSDLFEIRESQKQEEVKQLEKRLQDLKESLKMRKENKTEIVNRRIQELLGNSKYLRW
jgi:hypothetical protein